jgi:hypothetical protein
MDGLRASLQLTARSVRVRAPLLGVAHSSMCDEASWKSLDGPIKELPCVELRPAGVRNGRFLAVLPENSPPAVPGSTFVRRPSARPRESCHSLFRTVGRQHLRVPPFFADAVSRRHPARSCSAMLPSSPKTHRSCRECKAGPSRGLYTYAHHE